MPSSRFAADSRSPAIAEPVIAELARRGQRT
jgi:hypothetical protein